MTNLVNPNDHDQSATPAEGNIFGISEMLDHCLDGGVIAIDERECIVAFAGQAEACTGLPENEMFGKPASVLPSPLRELLQKTFATGKPHRNAQMLLRSDDGRRIQARVTTAVLRGPNGKPRGALALLHDLGPIRNLEQRLRRLDRLASLGTLSASVAHEVKNALVAVKTFVDLLRQKNPDAPLAEVVNREIGRIDSIVSQLLRFSGTTRPALEPLHLHEVLDRALGLMQHQFETNKIQITRSFEAAPDLLQGDAYQLEQALMNLFLNALEATGNEGKLNVTTQHVEPDAAANTSAPLVCLTIHDSGMGIPPEHLDRLFEPFFTTKSDGTGLGLPITRRIVQEHQGSIRVESRPGEGTKFVLQFPSAAKQP
jgi:PAS domain S-box-containing protein